MRTDMCVAMRTDMSVAMRTDTPPACAARRGKSTRLVYAAALGVPENS